MNIFYIDRDPFVAARAMTNKHVVKMILESAQLLCTAHHVLDGDEAYRKDRLYKPTHVNHPSAKWVRESRANYEWLFDHFLALVCEYYYRYGSKIHLTYDKLGDTICFPPRNIKTDVKFTPPPCAMPEQYIDEADHVKSYRAYYVAEKLKNDDDIARYKKFLGV